MQRKTIDFLGSFTFIFNDKDWIKKLLITSIFVFLNIFGICFLVGYMMKLFVNIRNKKYDPLPQWDDYGELFKDGLYMILIIFVSVILLGTFEWMLSSIIGHLGIIGEILNKFVDFIFSVIGFAITTYVFFKYAINRDFNKLFDANSFVEFMKMNAVNLVLLYMFSILFSLVAASGLLLFIVGIFITAAYSFFGMTYLAAQLEDESDVIFSEFVR